MAGKEITINRGQLRWLWKRVAALAILLILIHAPEFAFLIDAAYLDVIAILLACTALGWLTSLRDGVLFVGGLQASLMARPHGFALCTALLSRRWGRCRVVCMRCRCSGCRRRSRQVR